MYVGESLAAILLLADVKEMFLQKLMEYTGFREAGQRMTVD